MENLKKFVFHFIENERIADQLFLKRDLATRNLIVDDILNAAISNLLLANKINEPLDFMEERRISRFGNSIIKPRHLYKITQYNNKEYGTLWACYVSVANPITDTVKSIANCLVVAEIEGQLKFISKFIYDDDDLVWKHVGGIDLNFHELGTVQQVERLLSPENDEWSMEEYLLDR